MELLALNESFETIYVLDRFESIIWTDRYSSYGDFEIYTYADQNVIKNLKPDYYLWSGHSDHLMIIEEIQIKTDVEEGNHYIVTGRSIESLLDRRIIWEKINLDGYINDQIKKIIDQNVINPSDQNRRIPNFIFKDSEDPYIKTLKIRTQLTGDNLYEAIKKICDTVNIGFKITLNDLNQFVFELYSGTDRSYDQDVNPYVVFSPNFENIINSNYYESKSSFKNVTLVAGEDEGLQRRTIVTGNVTSSGLLRRELYTDARDIVSSTPDGGQISDTEYDDLLKQRGDESLTKHKVIKSFDGQVEATQMYKYGEDFFMGDTAQLENEYGMQTKVRVIEFIHSENQSGIEEYPTFDIIEEVI